MAFDIDVVQKHPELKQYLSNSLDSCNHLLSTLNSVLSFEKFDAGGGENVELKEHSLVPTLIAVRKITDGMSTLLPFSIVIKSGCPDTYYGNEFLLKQILVNLIYNSQKFTSSGSIKLTVSLQPSTKFEDAEIQKYSHYLIFRVRDTGIGIESKNLAKLFEPFMQAQRDDRGTGLGLNIVRHFAQQMNGFCFAKSKGLGRGSKFYVCLPHRAKQYHSLPAQTLVINPETSPTDTLRISKLASSKEPKHILFAEDNAMSQKMLRLLLEKFGFVVSACNNGKEVVNEYFKHPSDYYCLALLDYEMPIMNGLTAAKQIRAANFKIPIVILTAHTTEKDREECLQNGANDFLTKPISQKDLSASLQKWVK